MNRQQLFESLWVSVADRLPPDILSYWVLAWNPKCHAVLRYPARGIREVTKRRLDGFLPENGFQNDKYSAYWITHWMKAYPPEGQKDTNQILLEKKK